ncbi:Syntaxin-like protein psy1 [Fusarium oxysporum f. sp. albedinis]|nr:Syntaxin-like protein psy1 [Fusarium oxysporum f. sp. albedinis]
MMVAPKTTRKHVDSVYHISLQDTNHSDDPAIGSSAQALTRETHGRGLGRAERAENMQAFNHGRFSQWHWPGCTLLTSLELQGRLSVPANLLAVSFWPSYLVHAVSG